MKKIPSQPPPSPRLALSRPNGPLLLVLEFLVGTPGIPGGLGHAGWLGLAQSIQVRERRGQQPWHFDYVHLSSIHVAFSPISVSRNLSRACEWALWSFPWSPARGPLEGPQGSWLRRHGLPGWLQLVLGWGCQEAGRHVLS